MQRSGWLKLTAIAFSLGIFAAACGSDDSGGSASETTGAGEATTAAPAGGGGDTTAAPAAGGGGDYVIGVSNTLAGNGWREEMICAVKAQSLASARSARSSPSPRTAARPSRSRTCRT